MGCKGNPRWKLKHSGESPITRAGSALELDLPVLHRCSTRKPRYIAMPAQFMQHSHGTRNCIYDQR